MVVSGQAANTYRTGMLSESRAAWFLRLKGYRILARRYKTPLGEIDIIARRGRLIAFVEVKRRATMLEALSCLTPAMQRRIANAARHFIAAYPDYGDYDMRFDLMALGRGLSIRHLDNAWQTPT